jgi:uncharacterized protein (TIGR03435 family)
MITTQFLAQWALRSSILILCGALLLKALRVQDPSARLAAWTAMLLGSLAIPLLSVTLPAMPVTTRSVAVAPAPVHYVAPTRIVAALTQEIPPEATPKRFDWVVAVYLSMAGALLLRLAAALAMSRRLLRRSRPACDPDVRESDRISSPVTLGIVRPVILLPADWREWNAEKLAAVLAHERSHIRRHDPAVQLLSAIHRALLWYSPLSWYLDRQIVRLAEQASDDAAIAAVNDRASYAETLLEFMQRSVRRTSWQGVPMARYQRPERRIDRILEATTLSRGVTRWTIAAIVVLGLPLAYVVAAAQERLTFEAASVKPTPPPGVSINGGAIRMSRNDSVDPARYRNTGGPGTTDPGRIHYPLISLSNLVSRAYQGDYFEIKTPDWADTDIVSVDATMPADTTKEQFQKMLQNLLIDRFALKTHVETKELAGYILTVAKEGPKFHESQPDNEPPGPNLHQTGADGWPVPPAHMKGIAFQGMPGERARLLGPHATMEELAKMLGPMVDSRVEDRTGLKAAYNITLTFAGHLGGPHGITALQQAPAPSADPAAPEPLPDIFSALQSQLGLKLEKQKISVDVLVVDHMEKTPTGN